MGNELWTCPKCGHRFVTRNMWHSCSNYPLESHFERTSPGVRATFDQLVKLIEENGPVEVIPQKTRIAIQAKVRFAGCTVRKRWLLAHLWLTRRAGHPALQRVEKFGPRTYVLQFRLDSPDDLDEALRELIKESYAVGLRQHLADSL